MDLLDNKNWSYKLDLFVCFMSVSEKWVIMTVEFREAWP